MLENALRKGMEVTAGGTRRQGNWKRREGWEQTNVEMRLEGTHRKNKARLKAGVECKEERRD